MYKMIQYLRAITAVIVVQTHVGFKLEVHSTDILSWLSIGGYGVGFL